MENEKTKTEETKEVKQTPSMVQSAYEVAEKLKAENARMEANIKQLQELKAFETLGGQSEGRPQEVKQTQISDEEYARLALEGKIQAE